MALIIVVFELVYEFKLEVLVSIESNLLFCVLLIDATDADKLPKLVDTEELNVEYPVVPVILTCIDPEITPSLSNLDFIVVLIEDVKLFKLLVDVSIDVNLPAVLELNVLREPVDVSIASNLPFCVLSVVAIDEDKLPIEELIPLVLVAIDELNEPILEDKLDVVVATEELKLLILVVNEELNDPIDELNPLVVTAIDPLNVLTDADIEELNVE